MPVTRVTMPDGFDTGPVQSIRLDLWLDVTCLFRTRSEAQKACALGRVRVNGQPAKPGRLVRPGDRLEIARLHGRTQQIEVRALADRHVRKAEARNLYVDKTPPPSPEEIERRRLDRMYRAAVVTTRAPGTRERRALRALKGKS